LKRRILLVCLLALLVLTLATVRIKQDERGVWTGQGPGIEVIYLPDQAGPVLWLYLRGYPVWHIEAIREALPDTVPAPSPATPTPVRLGPMELEQA
jgi:hypothetical protein